jgi:hypothetical protein
MNLEFEDAQRTSPSPLNGERAGPSPRRSRATQCPAAPVRVKRAAWPEGFGLAGGVRGETLPARPRCSSWPMRVQKLLEVEATYEPAMNLLSVAADVRRLKLLGRMELKCPPHPSPLPPRRAERETFPSVFMVPMRMRMQTAATHEPSPSDSSLTLTLTLTLTL